MSKWELYNAALAADKAFHDALVRTFGEKQAGDRRYDVDESAWPVELKQARAGFQAATADWLLAVNAERKAGAV